MSGGFLRRWYFSFGGPSVMHFHLQDGLVFGWWRHGGLLAFLALIELAL